MQYAVVLWSSHPQLTCCCHGCHIHQLELLFAIFLYSMFSIKRIGNCISKWLFYCFSCILAIFNRIPQQWKSSGSRLSGKPSMMLSNVDSHCVRLRTCVHSRTAAGSWPKAAVTLSLNPLLPCQPADQLRRRTGLIPTHSQWGSAAR